MATVTVYEVRFAVGSCLHYGVFIQTSNNGDGKLMDVRGSVNAGGKLVFNCRVENLTRFDVANAKGVISEYEINRMENLCRGIAPPDNQYGSTVMYEGYEPLCRCREWNDRVWWAIIDSGIMKGK